MPLTQQQLRDRIASDLMKKYQVELTAVQLRDALVAMDTNERAALLDSIKRGNERAVGASIVRAVTDLLLSLAKTEADSIVADNSLNASELNRWLGDG